MRAGWSATLIALGGGAAGLLMLGFIIFAAGAVREPEPSTVGADGIVVLTGGAERIAAGGRLMAEGRGRRMLVTGVNTRTSAADIMRLADLDERAFTCCVDLDYAALDTYGNASETRRWAEQHGFTSLIVVTSSYHMPRSLAELAGTLPHVRLIEHPVVPPSFRDRAWWLSVRSTRLLLSEYLKYLPVAARVALTRLLSPAGSASALAGRPPTTARAN